MPIDNYTAKMQVFLTNSPVNEYCTKLGLTWNFDSDSHYKFVKSSAMDEKNATELVSFLRSIGLRNTTLRCNGTALVDNKNAYHVDCLQEEVEKKLKTLLLPITQTQTLLYLAIQDKQLAINKILATLDAASTKFDLSKPPTTKELVELMNKPSEDNASKGNGLSGK